MIRCNHSNPIRNSLVLLVCRRVGLVLVFAVCIGIMCGCSMENKYVEIVIAGSDTVVTPVPRAEDSIGGASGAMPDQIYMPQETEAAKPAAENMASSASVPALTPTPVQTVTPTATPTPTPIIIPTPMPVITMPPVPKPTLTAAPVPTAAPVCTPTPAPTPNYEKLMQKELNDVYTEYTEEWERLYSEYETKCALVLQNLNYLNMDPQPDDPEYNAEAARLNGLLDQYAREFNELEEKLEAEYYAKYSAIYDKYGK